jgi:hypothetical protein
MISENKKKRKKAEMDKIEKRKNRRRVNYYTYVSTGLYPLTLSHTTITGKPQGRSIWQHKKMFDLIF